MKAIKKGRKVKVMSDEEVKTIVVGVIFTAMIILLGIVIASWMLGLL